jgi:mRNA-degrading endonuclease toxin of MazEF toxin-antitoxin module
MHPKPGEVFWVDLGASGKVRPLMVVSREDAQSERALSVCVPLTTAIRGGSYEVSIPRVRWMPGSDDGVANVLGISSIEHHRLGRRAGRFEDSIISDVRNRIAWMLELEKPAGKPAAS